VLEGAKELLGQTGVEMEGLLAQLQTDRDEARAARAEAERMRNQLRTQRAKLNAELDDLEERKRTVLERAREQSEQELSALRTRVQQVLRELERGRVHSEATAAVAGVARQAEAIQPLRAPSRRRQRRDRTPLEELKVGQPVYVASLERVGTVSSLPDERGGVEIQVGSLRTRVNVRELSRTDDPRAEPRREPDITYRLDMERSLNVNMQLDLRGKRAEEAIEELDRYLNDAYMAGLKMVRIVHGKGTGVVRHAVREQLASSPLVRSFEQAPANEGGEGATVAVLAV
jgi:DNA mismatch repair protein MutS2